MISNHLGPAGQTNHNGHQLPPALCCICRMQVMPAAAAAAAAAAACPLPDLQDASRHQLLDLAGNLRVAHVLLRRCGVLLHVLQHLRQKRYEWLVRLFVTRAWHVTNGAFRSCTASAHRTCMPPMRRHSHRRISTASGTAEITCRMTGSVRMLCTSHSTTTNQS